MENEEYLTSRFIVNNNSQSNFTAKFKIYSGFYLWFYVTRVVDSYHSASFDLLYLQ